MAEHIQTGLRGEDVAAQYLIKKGFRILECRYRCLGTDVDIIARNEADGSIRFVEVKSRNVGDGAGDLFGDFSPAAAVTARKAQRMLNAAEYYMNNQSENAPESAEMGVDLITVSWRNATSEPEVVYFADIFR